MTARTVTARLLIALGLIVVAFHLVRLATGDLTGGQFATGALIGLLVAGGGNHVRMVGKWRSEVRP